MRPTPRLSPTPPNPTPDVAPGRAVTGASAAPALARLGWSAFFAEQVAENEQDFAPRRIAAVHRSRLTALSPEGPVTLTLPPHARTSQYTVGDWVLADPHTHLLHRLLDRHTVLERHTKTGPLQLAGANIDTLFIVTSCNADFNLSRLERYLAFANQAGTTPVVLLTKADTVADARDYVAKTEALQRDLPVLSLNAKSPDAAKLLAPWCGIGQTVALVGSSGVGKSTLVNTLAGEGQDEPQLTGGIRESDGKGRHTTTGRSLHAIAGGGWVIDTPGIRSLQLNEVSEGLETLFAEITELAPLCKFRDCTHQHEPGCAVQAALAAGTLDPERFERWRKLNDENRGNAPKPGALRRGQKR